MFHLGSDRATSELKQVLSTMRPHVSLHTNSLFEQNFLNIGISIQPQ